MYLFPLIFDCLNFSMSYSILHNPLQIILKVVSETVSLPVHKMKIPSIVCHYPKG